MFGLYPLSGAALGDVGVTGLSLVFNGVTAQNPTVDQAVVSVNNEMGLVYTPNAPIVPNLQVFEDENFAPPDVITGSVRIDNAPVTINLNLSFSQISIGSPTVDNATVTREVSLTADNVEAQNPTVGNATITEETTITFSAVSAQNPTVGNATVTEVINILLSGVSTQNPVVDSAQLSQQVVANLSLSFAPPTVEAMRFRFSEISLPPKVYSEIIIPAKTYTEQLDAS